MHRKLLGTAFIIASLNAVLWGNIASASSVYDGHYRHTNTAEVQGTVCTSIDITSDWSRYILDEDKWGSGNTTQRNSAKNSLTQALTGGGRWAVSEVEYSTGEKYVKVYWTTDGALSLQWGPTDIMTTAPAYEGNYVFIKASNSGSAGACVPDVASIGIGSHSEGGYGAYMSNVEDPYTNIHNLFIMTDYPNYPVGYEGMAIVTGSTDTDGDGLTAAKEAAQGTSDNNTDTDGDGLNDYIESQWNSSRDDIFCGTECSYPNPNQKDLYVEIDWMKDGSNHSYKPSSTQLELVKNMFANKNIVFHADTGQFGGGNELPTYTQALPRVSTTSQPDYWDYKNGGDGIALNFSTDRSLIWRYMIYGYGYLESSTSTGWAETMGDDLFISGGIIENAAGLANMDRAVANTIAHEIGHSLCLSDEQFYEEQPTQCVYGGIDNKDENDSEYNLENYESVMNYRYQLTDQDDLGIVNYSDGTRGSEDHNDWGAVLLGMNKFSGTHTGLGAMLALSNNKSISPDGSVIIDEAPISEITENNERQVNEKTKSKSNPESSTTFPENTQNQRSQGPASTSTNNKNRQQPHGNYLLQWGSAITLFIILVTGIIWLIKKR